MKKPIRLDQLYLQLIDSLGDGDLIHDIYDSMLFTGGGMIREAWTELYKDYPDDFHRITIYPTTQSIKKYIIKQLHLVNIKDISIRNDMIFPESNFDFRDPEIFGKKGKGIARNLNIPPQEIYYLKDVSLTGAFQIIAENKLIVYDKTAVPNKNIVAGVWRYFLRLDNDSFLYNQKVTAHAKFRNGILLSGRATENYYHWLIEYLPRIYTVLCSPSIIPRETPLIIKKGLPKQFYESLELLCPEFPTLLVDPDLGPIEFEELIVPSMHSYLPDDFSIPYWKGGAVSIKHLKFLRETILKRTKNNQSGHKRIYLKRNGVRSLENNHEIEELMIEKKFRIVRPELLSFAEQVDLFQNSEIIVGAGGAAMANLIFTNPASKILCLVSHRNRDFCTQSNLAQITGASYKHVIGPNTKKRSQCDSEDEYVHSSFTIDVNDLRRALGELGIEKIC